MRINVEGARRLILPIGVTFLGGLAIAGCKGEKPAEPTLENNPVTPIVIQCDPEQFAKEMGVPTPYPRGMEGAPENIIAIQKRIDQCLATEQDRKDMLAFNAKVEAAATAGAATAQAKQPETPPPIQTVEPPPEVKVAPVEIFPKEMDPYIEIIDFLNAKNQHVFIVGITGLPKGMTEVPISAPIGGTLENDPNDPNWATIGNLNDPTLTSFTFNGIKPVPNNKIEPGNNIGVLTDTGYRQKLGDKEYIATMYASTKDPSTGQWDWKSANKIVRQHFPRAPIVPAEYNTSTASNSATPAIKHKVAFEDEQPAGLK